MDPSASSGSIDVQFSNSRLPAVTDVATGAASDALSDALGEPTDITRAPTTEAARGALPAIEGLTTELDPEPDPIDLSPEPEHARSSARIVARRAEALIGHGVSRIGDGIDSLGKGVTALGERAAKVPVFGESVRNFGEGLSEVGASLHNLPAVSQSKRGRVLFRSMLVAFLLVFAWIAGIVMLQLRDSGKPDFRPLARKILIAVRDGHAAKVWTEASPRFQEVVREQRFIDDMADMKRTLGAFREIAAINETIVTTSANGRIGRVALTLQFDKGSARANVSFHRDAGRWKLLGIVVDTPPELPITQESRKERSELPAEVLGSAIKVLQAGNIEVAKTEEARGHDAGVARSTTAARDSASATHAEADRDRRSEQVWDQASAIFHNSATRPEFVRLQRERHDTLGNFVRVIEYRSGSKKYQELNATFTGLVEYQHSVVSAALTFARTDERAPWILNSFKVVLPMPRPDDAPADGLPRVPAAERPRPGSRNSRSDEPKAEVPSAETGAEAGAEAENEAAADSPAPRESEPIDAAMPQGR
jgi:Protein of unknown function (DUF4019)